MIVSQFYSLSDTFKFGQYKGMALSDVIDWDYQYIYWCMNSISNMEFLIYDSAIEELKQNVNRIKATRIINVILDIERLISFCAYNNR